MSSRAIRGPLRFNTYQTVTSGNYAVVNESLIVVNKTVGAATAITLPASQASNPGQIRQVIVLDGKGDAATNAITVSAAGTDTVNGGASVTMSANYAYGIFVDLGGGKWAYDPAGAGGSAAFVNLVLTGLLTESSADALTALGTNQGTALALTKEVNRITAGASTTGVTLPAASAGLSIIVINSVGNSINVYGAGTDTINDVATATGVVQPANSICLYACTTSGPAGKWYAEGIGGGYSGSLATLFTVGGIAAAGTTQGTATALTAMVNRVTTCAAGAGVVLPTNAVGLPVTVTNDGANALTVYPDAGAAINSLGTNNGTLIPVGQTATFTCEAANVWKTAVFPPREVVTALNTVGAGTLTAAGIVGGTTTRGGSQSNTNFTDTTDTVANLIAALHGAAVGQSWEWTYENTTNAVATLSGAASVTVSGITAVPPGTWARYLVTFATATTFTLVGYSSGPNVASQPPARQTTSPTAASTTLVPLSDLTVEVSAGQKVTGLLMLFANDAGAAGDGLKFTLDGGTATFTSIEFGFVGTPAGCTIGVGTSTAVGTALTGTTVATTDSVYLIAFSGVVNAAGTLIPQFAKNSGSTGNATVKLNSSLTLNTTSN